jgi:hypothetical protein
MSRKDPTGATAISLQRRFFAPCFETTPSLRVTPLRGSLADEEATLFLSHLGRTAFRTTDWIYSRRCRCRPFDFSGGLNTPPALVTALPKRGRGACSGTGLARARLNGLFVSVVVSLT